MRGRQTTHTYETAKEVKKVACESKPLLFLASLVQIEVGMSTPEPWLSSAHHIINSYSPEILNTSQIGRRNFNYEVWLWGSLLICRRHGYPAAKIKEEHWCSGVPFEILVHTRPLWSAADTTVAYMRTAHTLRYTYTLTLRGGHGLGLLNLAPP